MPGGGKKNNNKNNGGQAFKFEFGAPDSSGPVIKTEKTGKPSALSLLSEKDRAAAQAALLPILQKRLGNLIGKSSGYFETLPKPVQNRVKVLKTLQHQKDEIDTEYKKELAALEKKYREKKQPLFERRTAIVNGASDITPEELVAVEKEEKEKKEKAEKDQKEEKKEGGKEEKDVKKEEKEVKKEEKKEETPKSDIPEDAKGVPGFWLEVLKHYDEFGQMIAPEDEEALKSLTDICVRYVEAEKPTPSFAVDFHFDSNSFFENKVLSKTYYLEENDMEGMMFDHVDGTEVQWKPGKSLTVKLVTKQQKVKGGGGKRGGRGGGAITKTVTVEEPCESFFNFFNPDVLGEMIEGETEEEYEDELQMAYENDYDLGLVLKTQIIPNAVLWFTGEAEEGGDYDEEDEEDGEEGEEGKDGEGDEEYNSEEDEDYHPAPESQGDQPKCENQVQ